MKRSIKVRRSVGATATVVLRRAVALPRVVSCLTTIVIVRRGGLELERNGRKCSVGPGQAIAVPAGMAFDFTYHPDKYSGFLAQWLIPCLAETPRNAAVNVMTTTEWMPRPLDVIDPQFRQSLDRAIGSINGPDALPNVVAIHHMQDAMRWIGEKGGSVCAAPAFSYASSIWNILAVEPTRDWLPLEVAERMGVSPTRLIDRLCLEGTTFVRILHDVRMAYALSLVLATDRPVYKIAPEIGYRSKAQFRLRFHQRYGLLPGEVRGRQLVKRSHAYIDINDREPMSNLSDKRHGITSSCS